MKRLLLAASLLLPGLLIAAPGQDQRRVDRGIVTKPGTDVTGVVKSKSEGYELRCRGGGGLTSQDFRRMSEYITSSGELMFTMSMSLLAETERAAGEDSSGLHEGHCGWIDRPMNRNETFDSNTGIAHKLLYFTTPAKDAQTIPEYMKASNHYWSFFGVFKDGNFRASSHKAWTRPPSPYDTKPRNMGILTKP